MCLCCSKGGVADLAEWCDCGSSVVEEGSYQSAVIKWGGVVGGAGCSLLFSETIKGLSFHPRASVFSFLSQTNAVSLTCLFRLVGLHWQVQILGLGQRRFTFRGNRLWKWRLSKVLTFKRWNFNKSTPKEGCFILQVWVESVEASDGLTVAQGSEVRSSWLWFLIQATKSWVVRQKNSCIMSIHVH